MFKRGKILTLSALISTCAICSYSFLPEYLKSKMVKQVCKLYDKQTNAVELPIANSLLLDHQVFSLVKEDSIIGYSIISRALGCNIGGCEKPSSSNAFEQFFFMTAFDRDKNIKKVRVLEYTSNHGYQVANKGWLKQFEDKKQFKVGQNIDAISGATISVKSITSGVNNQIKIIDSY